VIDPKTIPYEGEELNGQPCRVRHIARKFQEADIDLGSGAYGLVMLGYSLKPFGSRPALDERLFALIDGARIAILDYAPALARAADQVPLILARPGVSMVCGLDLIIDDPELRDSPYAHRRFIVFRSASSPA
jgi:hypothetical protein